MFNILKKIIAFLFPIVRSAVLQVAADELNRIAYSPKPDVGAKKSYNTFADSDDFKPDVKVGPNPFRNEEGTSCFHDVLLVAFDISGPNTKATHEWLMNQLPDLGDGETQEDMEANGINIDSWWVANDERFDYSDTDSAIFVRKGEQRVGRKTLRANGLVD